MDVATGSSSAGAHGRDTASGPPVVVIGAGFAGLAAAVRLIEAGRRVILCRGHQGRRRSLAIVRARQRHASSTTGST